MKVFIVNKDVDIIAVNKQFEFIKTKTKNENMFFLEDVVIDPLNYIDDDSLGTIYASQGNYGFVKGEWMMIVNHKNVKIK